MAITVTHHTAGPLLEYAGNVSANAASPENYGIAFRVCTLTFDSSYPTGGEALAATGVEATEIVHVIAPMTSGYVFQWDQANLKLLAYYADYNAVGDGALIQVPNTTDLATLAPRCLILCR